MGVITGSYNLAVACSDAPALRVPERPALIHERGGRTDVVSFRELAERSSALAARLTEAGVEPGDRVGVFASAGNEAAIAHISAMKAGGVTVPLVPLLGDDAIAYRLADAGVVCVVTEEATHQRLDVILADADRDCTAITIGEEMWRSAGESERFEPYQARASDPAMIIYTSGTTGKPKGAVEPHSIVLGRHAPMAMIHGPFVPEDVFWTPVDWMWIGSFVDSLLTPLSYGCTVLAYERRRFDGLDAVRRLKDFRVTKAFIPPTALRIMMDVPEVEWTGHSLTSVHSGGETLTNEAFEWARECLGITVDEIYGMTEASFTVGQAHRYYPRVAASMGRPYPGQEVMLRTDDGGLAGFGEPGEVMIGPASPSLFLGYFNRADATSSRFADGWFATGDLAVRDEQGYLFYVGRKDDLIMSAGHRLGPGEIEAALQGHPAVRAAVVVGAPDPRRGQRVKAAIQLVDGVDRSEALDDLTRELQDLVRVNVGRHAYPREIEYVEDFPRTVTGKIRRDLLRMPSAGREDS